MRRAAAGNRLASSDPPKPTEGPLYRRYFACYIEWESSLNGFTCARASLDLPNPLADETKARHAGQLLNLVELGPEDAPLGDQARRAISLLLPSGRATMDHVATTLGLSSSALRRRLDRENRLFANLLNEVRRELAQRYLANSGHSITEISDLIGYTSIQLLHSLVHRRVRNAPNQLAFGTAQHPHPQATNRPQADCSLMDGQGLLAAMPTTKAASPRCALTILFLVVAANLFDRQLINILAQDIKLDLGLSDAGSSRRLLTGTAFGLLKAAFSIPIGAWSDRNDRSRILAGLVALRSVFSLLCAATTNFPILLAGRAGAGLGESAAVPISTAMAREYFPHRGTSAIAITMAGNPVGTFLAFLVGGLIAQRWGWRWAFLAASLPGLLLAWLVLAKLRDNAAKTTLIGSSLVRDAIGLIRRPWSSRWSARPPARMFIVNTASAWMPAFLIRAHGLGTAQAGFYLAIPSALAEHSAR